MRSRSTEERRKQASALELRLPPVAALVLFGGAVWATAALTPEWTTSQGSLLRGVLAVSLVALGDVVALAGVRAFHRHKTTVNPMRPDASSSLVESGIYAWTRNPMYLGMHLALVGLAIWLGNLWGLVSAHAFALFITRYQIAPEERILEERFGGSYLAYKSRVGRWFGAPRSTT